MSGESGTPEAPRVSEVFDPRVIEAVALSLAFDQPANQSLHTLHYATVAELTEEARKCLTAAFSVLDDEGIPRVIIDWLADQGEYGLVRVPSEEEGKK